MEIGDSYLRRFAIPIMFLIRPLRKNPQIIFSKSAGSALQWRCVGVETKNHL
jgi:hypothetical protein